MLVGSNEVCVELSDRVMIDPIVSKRVRFREVQGGEAAGTGYAEFHEKSTGK